MRNQLWWVVLKWELEQDEKKQVLSHNARGEPESSKIQIFSLGHGELPVSGAVIAQAQSLDRIATNPRMG
jgi:hypothetical protein